MSEFWLWFWRPIAETLGILALIFGVCVVYLLICVVAAWRGGRK